MKGTNSNFNKENKLERVIVHARMRPFTEEELKHDSSTPIETFDISRNVIVVRKDFEKKFFNYDSVFPPSIKQTEVYERAARSVIESVLKGYNGTIFAYGQTGTGKTFTMAGDFDDEDKRGIIPLSFEHIYEEIRKDTEYKYTVNIAFIQIYLETLQDLLEPNNDNIRIREDPEIGVYIEGVEWIKVTNEIECRNVFATGEKNRITASTKMNSHSSRSHAILIVKIEKSKTFSVEDIKKIAGESSEKLKTERLMTKSMLYLVDLAGSERVKKTKADSMRLEEAKKINYSLLVLGNCIQSLTDPKANHISYRDSKLTRLLQDSLGGNAKTSLIVTISPSTLNVEETVSSLMFGQRAMKVQNKPIINKSIDYEALCIKLQEDLDKLNQNYAFLKEDYEKVCDENRRIKNSENHENVDENKFWKKQFKNKNGKSKEDFDEDEDSIDQSLESEVSISYSVIDQVKEKCEEEMKKLEVYYEEILKAKLSEHEKILKEINNIILIKENEMNKTKMELKALIENHDYLTEKFRDISKEYDDSKNLIEKKTNELIQLKKTNESLLKELKSEKEKNEKTKINKETQTDHELTSEKVKCNYDKKIFEIATEIISYDKEKEKLDKPKIENLITLLYDEIQTKNKLLEEKSSHFLKFLSSQKNKEFESHKNFEEMKNLNEELIKKIEIIHNEHKREIEKIKDELNLSNSNLLKEIEKFENKIEILKVENSSMKETIRMLEEKNLLTNKEKENYSYKVNQMKEIIETIQKEKKINNNKNELEDKSKKIQKLEDELKNTYVQIQSYANSEKFLKSSFNDLDNILNKTFIKMRLQYENLISINKEIKKIDKKKEIENFTSDELKNLNSISNYDNKIFELLNIISESNSTSKNSKNVKIISNKENKNLQLKSKSKSPIKIFDMNINRKLDYSINKKNISDINTNTFYAKFDEISNISLKISNSYEAIINYLLKILKNYSQMIKSLSTNLKVNDENINTNINSSNINYETISNGRDENSIKNTITIFLKKTLNYISNIFPQIEIESFSTNYEILLNCKKSREVSFQEFNKISYEFWDEIMKIISLHTNGKDLEIENLNERVIYLLRELEIFKKFGKGKNEDAIPSQISKLENVIKLKNEENENLRSRIEENIKMIVKLKNDSNSKSNDNSYILSTSNVTQDKKDLNATENLMKKLLHCEEDGFNELDDLSKKNLEENFDFHSFKKSKTLNQSSPEKMKKIMK